MLCACDFGLDLTISEVFSKNNLSGSGIFPDLCPACRFRWWNSQFSGVKRMCPFLCECTGFWFFVAQIAEV